MAKLNETYEMPFATGNMSSHKICNQTHPRQIEIKLYVKPCSGLDRKI